MNIARLSIDYPAPDGISLAETRDPAGRLTGIAGSPGGILVGPDPANFCVAWRHPDRRMDELQRVVSRVAAEGAHGGEDPVGRPTSGGHPVHG